MRTVWDLKILGSFYNGLNSKPFSDKIILVNWRFSHELFISKKCG